MLQLFSCFILRCCKYIKNIFCEMSYKHLNTLSTSIQSLKKILDFTEISWLFCYLFIFNKLKTFRYYFSVIAQKMIVISNIYAYLFIFLRIKKNPNCFFFDPFVLNLGIALINTSTIIITTALERTWLRATLK